MMRETSEATCLWNSRRISRAGSLFEHPIAPKKWSDRDSHQSPHPDASLPQGPHLRRIKRREEIREDSPPESRSFSGKVSASFSISTIVAMSESIPPAVPPEQIAFDFGDVESRCACENGLYSRVSSVLVRDSCQAWNSWYPLDRIER